MLYLHIGTHKTATTLIQKNIKKYISNNFKITKSLNSVKNTKNRNYLLTNEGFFVWDWMYYMCKEKFINSYLKKKNIYNPKDVETNKIDMNIKNMYFFEKSIKKYNWKLYPKTHVIVYFRDPISYVESSIQQLLKEGYVIDINKIDYEKILSSINYTKVVNILKKYFSKVTVKWYETIHKIGAEKYIGDFLKTITKKIYKIKDKFGYVNIGLTKKMIIANNKKKITRKKRKSLERKSQFKYNKDIIPQNIKDKYKDILNEQKKKLKFPFHIKIK
jgi:hypothetical protein